MWGLVSKGSSIGILFQWRGCDMRKWFWVILKNRISFCFLLCAKVWILLEEGSEDYREKTKTWR